MATHKIVHIEIPTSDGKQSSEFYGKLFGWPADYVENYDYWMYNPAEGPGGGFNKLSAEGPMAVKPGEVIIYVTTDDIEGSLAEAESLGGKILLNRTVIPGVGWFGLFADPTGNRVAVYTSMNTGQ